MRTYACPSKRFFFDEGSDEVRARGQIMPDQTDGKTTNMQTYRQEKTNAILTSHITELELERERERERERESASIQTSLFFIAVKYTQP
jgi:hypothetical protein